MNIVIDKISKQYGEKQVFRDFSAVLEEGKTTALMGASGCGKTTLCRILLGLEKADSGTITGIPDRKSVVLQEDALSENYSAVANIKAVRKKHNVTPSAEEILCALGLENDIRTPVRLCSGGMKRRIAIARALYAEYDFLVLDEPFKGLDDRTEYAVLAYVKAMTKGKTVLLITHEKKHAQCLADTVIYL